MEAKNMAAPENLRRGRFPITSSTRERGRTTVLPKPDVAPSPLQPKKGKEKKGIGTKTRIALAGLAVAGTGYVGGAIVNEQINDMPLSARSVANDAAWPWNLGKSAAEDIAGMLHKEPPSVFDNSVVKGEISLNNILYVPREVFDKTPLADAQGNPIFDFPWDRNNPAEIKYTKSLWPEPDWWKSGVDPKTEIKNSFEATTTLPAGFEFPTPYPGRVFFAGSGPYDEEASRKSPSNPYGLAVYKEGPITGAKVEFLAPDGILYFVNISIDRSSGGSLPFEPLIDVVLISPDNQNARDWKKGILVERGQKIFRVTQKGRLGMYIEGGKNGRLDGPEIEHIPGNFQFQTQKDSAGVEKLLVPEGK